jgi:hypothetical protein
MKQLPRFFGGLPAMPSPSSSTRSGRYFSRNAETSPVKLFEILRRDTLSLDSTIGFSRKVFCVAVHQVVF